MRSKLIPFLAMLAAVSASAGPDVLPDLQTRPRRRVRCPSCGAYGAATVEPGEAVTCPRCGSKEVEIGAPILEAPGAEGAPIDPPPGTPSGAFTGALAEIRDAFGPVAASIALVVARGLPPGSSLTVSDAGAVSFSLPEGWVDPWVEAGDALWIVALASIPAPPSQVAESVLRRLRARNDGATVPDAPEPGDVDPDVATG